MCFECVVLKFDFHYLNPAQKSRYLAQAVIINDFLVSFQTKEMMNR